MSRIIGSQYKDVLSSCFGNNSSSHDLSNSRNWRDSRATQSSHDPSRFTPYSASLSIREPVHMGMGAQGLIILVRDQLDEVKQTIFDHKRGLLKACNQDTFAHTNRCILHRDIRKSLTYRMGITNVTPVLAARPHTRVCRTTHTPCTVQPHSASTPRLEF